ncbi:MAG: hypothetical protein J6D03_09725 [Clostridia bacterium]|nr:hypothetical protein [Clostridia bacterium]
MEGESVSISFPSEMKVSSSPDSPLYVDATQKAERYMADLARQLYVNTDFSQNPKPADNIAKDAISRAQSFWNKLPESWKSSITG